MPCCVRWFCVFRVDGLDRATVAELYDLEISQSLGAVELTDDDQEGAHQECGLKEGVGTALRTDATVGKEGEGIETPRSTAGGMAP